MKRYLRDISLCLLMILLLSSVAFGEEVFPTRQGMINDFANVIPPNIKAEMDARSREILKKTGTTIAVATVPTTGENYTSDYANRLYQAWGVGKKGVNKGVLIFVAVKERKVRIETGYGVEGILPDGKVGEILRSEILPHFKKNDYGTGLLNAVNAISRVIAEDAKVNLDGTVVGGEMIPATSQSPPEIEVVGNWAVMIFMGIVLGIFVPAFFLAKKYGGRGGSARHETDTMNSSGGFVPSDSNSDSVSDSSDSSDSGGFDGGESGGGGSESDY